MTTKLTLSINKRVIDKAKRYAKKQGRSLSDLVQNLLTAVTVSEEKNGADKTFKIDPDIESLSGMIKAPKNFDYKKVLEDAFVEKYMK